jgi:hypothetical protein
MIDPAMMVSFGKPLPRLIPKKKPTANPNAQVSAQKIISCASLSNNLGGGGATTGSVDFHW